MSISTIIRACAVALPLVLGAISLTPPASADPAAAPADALPGSIAPATATAAAAPDLAAEKAADEPGKTPAAGKRKKKGAAPKKAPADDSAPPADEEGKPAATATVTVTVADEGNAGAEDEGEVADPAEKARMAQLKKLSDEVAILTLERDKLVNENVIAKEVIIKELAKGEAETERLELEIEVSELRMKAEATKIKVALEKELADLRAEKERVVLNAEITKAKTDAELSRYKLIEEERKERLSLLATEIAEKEKQMERSNYTEQKPVYLENPLEGNALVISDRRVALNGPIFNQTADYISERINYFNNKDKKLPIFVVIDYSPGGSVMSGYKILKAMEGSEAPVYVVVKSYAASMAACITTLADKSFAYPNAIILHHQLSGVSAGNLTQQREFVNEAEEWWRRLAGPVAAKMGVNLDEFIKMMYTNRSTGDWVEFADKAQNLKWIDHIIEEVRETSLLKHPDAVEKGSGEDSPATYHYGLSVEADAEGKPCVTLPPLAPFDYYWLYNPDGFYRVK